LIKYRIDFTLSDVKCERSSICRIELSLASNDCNEWQVFNTPRFWILLLEILSMTRFCKVLRQSIESRELFERFNFCNVRKRLSKRISINRLWEIDN